MAPASIRHNDTGTSTVTCNTQQTQLNTNPPLSWPSTCLFKDKTTFKNRPCHFITVLSHYDAHPCCCHFTHNITTQTNSIPRITTSAATGACLTTLPRPVGSIISVQSTGARTYCRHVDSAAAYRCSAYSNIGTTTNFNTINTPGSIARIPSARGG